MAGGKGEEGERHKIVNMWGEVGKGKRENGEEGWRRGIDEGGVGIEEGGGG